MKHFGKKVLALIICACMALSLFGSVTFADDETPPVETAAEVIEEVSGDNEETMSEVSEITEEVGETEAEAPESEPETQEEIQKPVLTIQEETQPAVTSNEETKSAEPVNQEDEMSLFEVFDTSGLTAYTVDNDGSTSVSAASFDQYFEGTAAEGVKALLDAGRGYINGIPLPGSEPTSSSYVYQINWVDSLYVTATGWGYNVHKTTSANNMTFEDARKEFFDMTSTVKGHKTTLYLDSTGMCQAIALESYEVVRIADMMEQGDYYTFSRGDFQLETNRVRYDFNNIKFDKPYVDQSIAINDIGVYWYGSDVLGGTARWHIVKATPVVGKVSKSNGIWYVGENAYNEASVSRYNLIDCSRPTQGYTAYTRMGLTDRDIVLWLTPNEYAIGFTYGETKSDSQKFLKAAIANARALLADVTASEDGENVTTDKMWATQDAIDAFNAAITTANGNITKPALTADSASYALSQAWGDANGGFVSEIGYGFLEPSETEKVIDHDGSTTISDETYDQYFEGTASDGVEALLNAGKVSINGLPLPKTEDETDCYQINLTDSLYKKDTGWGYNVHKTTSANTLTFEDARKQLVDMTSTVRGHQTTMTLDENGKCVAIDIESFEVMKIVGFTNDGSQVTDISRGDFQLETNRVRYDADNITLAAANFADDIEPGDVVVYWNTTDGWHMIKAGAKVGIIEKVSNGVYGLGEWSHNEASVSRYNLIDDSRPTQGYTAYTRLGIKDAGIDIILWITPNESPIGFSYGDNAKAALTKAIENATALLASVTASENGEDVEVGKYWALKSDIDAFTADIAAAQAALDAEGAHSWDYEKAIYALNQKWGDANSGFVSSIGEGEMIPVETGNKVIDHDGSTTISDETYDQYFEGTASDGVEALLNAGKVSINGLPLPKTEDETDCYQINLTDSLYKKDTGWGYNVHKTTSANTLTFTDARKQLVDMTSTVRGHQTTMTLDENGKCVAIDIESFEVMKIVGFTNDGSQVTDISRGDFQLETNRVRYDADNITLAAANFADDIEPGDVVVYWNTTDGWHMIKAGAKVGIIEKVSNGVYGLGEWSHNEASVSRYNLIDDSRPTQGYTAYTRLGLKDAGVDIILWITPNESPIGFSYGDNAKAALTKAIENATALVESVIPSEDGEDVPSNRLWAFQSDIDAFTADIAAAQTALDAEGAHSWDYEKAIYALNQKWGDTNSGFISTTANGEADPQTPVETGDKIISHDGSTTISDPSYDKYYNGTASDGVEALLNSGKISINGLPLPKTENETSCYQINLTDSLYKTDTGWGYNVHKTTSANTLTFADARKQLVDMTSTVRGHQTTMTLDENGKCVAINIESFEVMKIVYFEDHGGMVDKIDRGDFQLETNRVRYDANNITGINSANGNFDTNIAFGDIVVFWYGFDDNDIAESWHMTKADSKVGIIEKVSGGVYGLGDWSHNEASVSRYNLIDDSRPTQGYTAYTRLGIKDAGISITLWLTPDGSPIGFTYGSNARTALRKAVANAEALLAGVKTSEDGEDIYTNEKWATEAAKNTFQEAINAAKTVSNSNASTNWAREKAIYALNQAWGDANSGFISEVGDGYKEIEPTIKTIVINMGDDKTVDDTLYDSWYKEGNAADGVKALIAAGKVSINDFVIPAEEAAFLAKGFTVNGDAWIIAEDGGTYKVDRTGGLSYVDAAFAALKRVSNGNEIKLFDTDADGFIDYINAIYVEALIADEVLDNGDGTVTVKRGEPDESLVFEGKDGRVFDDSNSVVTGIPQGDIQPGDMVFIKETPDGWIIERAKEATGILVDGSDHHYYQIDDVQYADAMRFSRDNIIISNRCGELVNAHNYFGFMNNDEDLKVTLWLVNTTDPAKAGAPAGFTTAGNAATFLERAIAFAQNKLDSTVVSTDGTDVPADTMWTTQENIDDLQAAIDRAQSVLASGASQALMDYQVYLLYFALNGSAQDIGARFAGFNYEGFDNQIAEGTKGKDGWTQDEDGSWRYYENGKAVTGWKSVNGTWYYFNDNGTMRTGWYKSGSTWYYLKDSGAMATGWAQVGSTWYYFKDSGAMVTGWAQVGGTWYYFKDSGAMVTGWAQVGGTWYYFKNSGAMVTGWAQVGNTWYFFKSSGAMAASEWCEGYWLNADGSWTYQPKGSWKQNSSGWWFGDTSGWYAKNETVKIDNTSYRFNASGYWVR